MKVQNTILYSTPTHTILFFFFFFLSLQQMHLIGYSVQYPSTVPVDVHLTQKKLPVLDLEAVETCIMTIRINRTATMLKKTGQNNDTEKSHSLL